MAGILEWLQASPQGGPGSPGYNNMGIIGAALSDAAAASRGRQGNAVGDFNARGMMQDRYQRAAAAEDRQRSIGQKVREAYATGDMNAVRSVLVELAAQGEDISSIIPALKFGQPTLEQIDPTKDQYERDPITGALTLKQKGTPTGPSAPTGYRFNGDVLDYIPGGPADPKQARALSDSRRAPDGGGGQQAPSGYRWGATGNLEAIPGGPADSSGKNSRATDTQRVTALYADRAREAETALTGEGGVEAEGGKLWQNTMSKIPIAGNYAVSDDFQKYDQARRNFVNAVLRRESGAVISDQEFDNANKQYFPQPGDNEQVIEQKRVNRETAIEGLTRAAGTAMNSPMPQQAPKPRVNTPTDPRTLPQKPAGAKAAPAVGEVVKGYRFKGGNPASQSSWEKV